MLILIALEGVAMDEPRDQFINPGQIFGYIGDGKGIQGHQNSCYLDSTLFGLFAASDAFDSIFLEQDRAGGDVKHLLWKGIINPLRKYAELSKAGLYTSRVIFYGGVYVIWMLGLSEMIILKLYWVCIEIDPPVS